MHDWLEKQNPENNGLQSPTVNGGSKANPHRALDA